MILNMFLQSINLVIQLKSLIKVNTLIDPWTTLEQIYGISTTTGTVGTTITTGTLDTTVGSGLTLIGTFAALFIIAYFIDRWLNRKLELELTDLEEEYNQE